MPDSPPQQHAHGGTLKRPCDFCNESTALLYCRADNAKLCLACDREVHSTNPLFTKHTRSLLCDSCDSSPAAIFCSTDAAVHCQNCDWEAHNRSSSDSSATHDRRPIEGFTGCPAVADLLTILGFEDLSKKGVFGGEGSGHGGGSGHGFEDYLVWETPSFVSLDDLIVSSGDCHNFQAMGVPPLPKNRNAASGTYKDELVRQLRELAKFEPNVDGEEEDVIIKPVSKFEPPMATENGQFDDMTAGFERKSEHNTYASYEPNAFQWSYDSCDVGGRELHSDQVAGYNVEPNCVVPEKDSKIVHGSSHVNSEGQSHHTAVGNRHVFPSVNVREINSQERETAISRYKEKKKSRRYDKHIRYESRKVRAESRTRIRGRFAKIDR